MDYIFGTLTRKGKLIHILKTVGSEHTDLTGYNQVKREYPDCNITDDFVVVDHYLSKEDEECNCYDWYEIGQYYRFIDYFSPQKQDIEDKITETQDAIMEVDTDRLQVEADTENAIIELDEEMEQRLADIENALCELTEE